MPIRDPIKRQLYAATYRKKHPRIYTDAQKADNNVRETMRYHENRDKIREQQKTYYSNLSEEQKIRKRERGKKSYEKHKEKILIQHKQWRAKNPEKWKSIVRDWREENKVNLSAWLRTYLNHRYKTDTSFNLTVRLRNRVRKALTVAGTKRSQHIYDLVGCSLKDLKHHLEQQFTDGMSWERFSEIHIDHKRPVSSFDLSDPLQLSACFHFSNLQPLWATDNLRKSSTYTPYIS